jgi:hypothetical protein
VKEETQNEDELPVLKLKNLLKLAKEDLNWGQMNSTMLEIVQNVIYIYI